jgi:hypothetical protein
MAARPQGDGYWIVAEDGGVFAYGKAGFMGSWAYLNSHSPVIAVLPTTTGNGYAMLRRDGSVGVFGDAPNLGTGVGLVGGDAVGIVGKFKPL